MSTPVNPYASQHPGMDFSSQLTGDGPGVLMRPTGITVVSVFCILGGGLGLLAVLGGMMQLFLGEAMSNLFTPPGEDPTAELQKQMQAEVQALTNRYFIPNLLVLITKFVVCSCLLVGGIGLLNNRLWARSLLLRTLLVAMLMEVAALIVQTVMQWNMMPIMKKFMGEIAAQGGGAGGQGPPAELMATFATAGIVTGIVFAVLWTTVKLGLMLWGKLYLNRSIVTNYLSAMNPGQLDAER